MRTQNINFSFPSLKKNLVSIQNVNNFEPSVESEEILKGFKTAIIIHNGTKYKLQATKLGKLILMK